MYNRAALTLGINQANAVYTKDFACLWSHRSEWTNGERRGAGTNNNGDTGRYYWYGEHDIDIRIPGPCRVVTFGFWCTVISSTASVLGPGSRTTTVRVGPKCVFSHSQSNGCFRALLLQSASFGMFRLTLTYSFVNECSCRV